VAQYCLKFRLKSKGNNCACRVCHKNLICHDFHNRHKAKLTNTELILVKETKGKKKREKKIKIKKETVSSSPGARLNKPICLEDVSQYQTVI
jgi:hypothetical protein